MNVAAENFKILEEFVHESLEMVQRVAPFVRALIQEPDREDILPEVTKNGFRLFHSIKGSAGFLQLDHLIGPAEAMEYLLDRVRSGVLSLTAQSVSLLAEAIRFMEQGLPLVLVEKSDDKLAASAGALTAAILRSLYEGGKDSCLEGAVSLVPAEMREPFLWETDNLLVTAEQEFVLWDFIAVDHQRVKDLSRTLHRLQQNFALFELTDMERLCRALESTLTRYLQGEFFQTEYPERIFLRTIDAVRSTMNQFIEAEDPTVTGLEHHLDALQGLMRQPIGTLLIEAGLVDPQTIQEALEVQRSSQETMPRRLGEVLVEMGQVTQEQVHHVLHEQHSKRMRGEQAESMLADIGPSAGQSTSALADNHKVRIDGQKFARMVELIEHLSVEGASGKDFLPQLRELQGLAHACNREVLSSFTDRMKRVVHDVAVQSNKKVHFVIEGMDALLNQRDMALLADPLLHLLRNGVEHGLETTEQRMQVGKRKSGRLTLLALRQGDEIWVSVEDDGRGIDMHKIAALAVEQELIPPEQVAPYSSRELMERLFQSRTSTVEGVWEEAERSSGLAVVGKSLQHLQGAIEMWSHPGKGTRVTLKLPWKH